MLRNGLLGAGMAGVILVVGAVADTREPLPECGSEDGDNDETDAGGAGRRVAAGRAGGRCGAIRLHRLLSEYRCRLITRESER